MIAAAGRPEVLLLGRDRAADGSAGALPVLVLNVSKEAQEAISAMDWAGPHLPSVLAKACQALWLAGLRLQQIAKHLALDVSAPVIQRYVSAARCAPYVLEMLDKNALSWAHIRVLQALPRPAQVEWAGKVVTYRWSLLRLQSEVAGAAGGEQDADMKAYVASVQRGLQADEVRVSRGGRAGHYRVEIDWSKVPDLQGVLERLARAPWFEDAEALPVRRRTLSFALDSELELAAFLGHVVGEM